MTITRYTLVYDDLQDDDNGDYVLHADYQTAIAAEREEHRKALATAVAMAIQQEREQSNRVKGERDRAFSLLRSIRYDIQCTHWHKDIDAALAARKEGDK